MESQITIAFSLLGIGMITVFAVLFLVVSSGSLLIRLVNKFTPDPPLPVSSEIHPDEVAAITAAVEVFTLGKGRVTNIEKLKQ